MTELRHWQNNATANGQLINLRYYLKGLNGFNDLNGATLAPFFYLANF